MIPQGRFPQPTEVLIPVGVCSLPPACMLCGQAAADLVLWGHKVEQEHLCAHLFCLVSAPRLPPAPRQALLFIPEDIPCILERVVDKQCFVCGESGAAITCCREGCDRSFHLPCAMEGECVTQYFLPHSSCAAEGTHRRCANLSTSRSTWECGLCAGQGTGKRQSTFMPLGWGQGPGKAWQQVPRLGFAEPLCPRRAGGTALTSPQWPLCP
uniref:PHD-type domain-containing protein n=1 Tax=Athene cunicularia TaxID=194338 RepID=A0A663N2J2_ATHCN